MTYGTAINLAKPDYSKEYQLIINMLWIMKGGLSEGQH
jgi:hypothetical protein